MVLPIPTLDHVVVNVHDRLDDALQIYRRLGFNMTPRGYHTLGSMNHLAILGTDYIELIATRPDESTRPEIMASPRGLSGMVFATDDETAVYSELRNADIPIMPPIEFSRPVALVAGTRDAIFRTVRLPNETTSAGRIYFCHHLTRDLVWRDEWRHHPNGAIGIARCVIAARDPTRLADLFAKMFGGDAIKLSGRGYSLSAGLAAVDIVTPDELHRKYGTATVSDDDRDEFMAALTIRVRSFERAWSILKDSDATQQGGNIVVPTRSTFGVILEFQE